MITPEFRQKWERRLLGFREPQLIEEREWYAARAIKAAGENKPKWVQQMALDVVQVIDELIARGKPSPKPR